jgi:crotonobetainyl-CoA:carnitine CoA-transferase CaiB-like acyl-CoA transferase
MAQSDAAIAIDQWPRNNLMGDGGALQGVRVLDLSGEFGQFCGRLMGDHGADVIKIEPLEGDDVRRLGPFYEDVEDVDRSLYWHAMNTSKRSVTLNLETVKGRALLHRLLATTDIVVESYYPGTLARWELDFDTLHAQYPALIMASVTPFGQTGPYHDYRATEMETLALGSFMSVCGDPDRPPTRVGQPQATVFSSINAYTGAMLAYYHRLRGGEGQHIDASMQEGAANLHYAHLIWNGFGAVSPRMGTALTFGGGILIPISYACKDGHVQAIPALSWDTFIPWLDEHGMAGDLTSEAWRAQFERLVTDWTQEQVDHACGIVGQFLARFPKKELYEEAIRRRQLLYPVQTVQDAREDRQLLERQYFVDVEVPALGRALTYPGEPYRMSATPWRSHRPAPRLGEHNAAIYGDVLGLSEADLASLRQEGVI